MRILTLALPLLLLGLTGCADEDGGKLVHNDCTQHPKYGSGNPHVTLATNLGNITLEVFVDKVPNTGMNFVKLAEGGQFNGSKFHRIIADFMMQGGDYTMGTGSGGAAHPDCELADGNIADEFRADLKHTGKGILSMANTGVADSGGSQFFITFVATPHLDAYEGDTMKPCGQMMPGTNRYYSCHAVFGKVTEGLDVLDKVNSEAKKHESAQAAKPPAQRTAFTVEFRSATVTWP